MILCELENETIKGYEMIPSKEKVKEFKAEQLADKFKVYSAITNNNSYQVDNSGFSGKNINTISINDGRDFHVLEMYPYNQGNVKLYENIWKEIMEGKYDKNAVHAFQQSMKINNNLTLNNIMRFVLLSNYKKMRDLKEDCVYYKSDYVLEINEYLHYMMLLLQDTPKEFANQSKYFNFTEEQLAHIFSCFQFIDKPLFTTSLDYLSKLQVIGANLENQYLPLVEDSEDLLKLVRSAKK